MRIKTRTDKPPRPGYYIAFPAEKLRKPGVEWSEQPQTLFWNGQEWQDKSDDDEFQLWGNEKAITFEFKWFPEWYGIISEGGGILRVIARPAEE